MFANVPHVICHMMGNLADINWVNKVTDVFRKSGSGKKSLRSRSSGGPLLMRLCKKIFREMRESWAMLYDCVGPPSLE